jgi:hypothetical protein
MDELLSEIRKSTAKVHDKGHDQYLEMGKSYHPVNIDKKHHHEIRGYTHSEMLFVDGGSTIVFERAGLCVARIRVVALHYHGRRMSRNVNEFFLLTKDEDQYTIRTFPKQSFDGINFIKDIHVKDLHNVVDMVRRIAEFESAEKNHTTGYILLDGSLEITDPQEQAYIERLLQKGMVCGLSKTCSLTTNTKQPITSTLLKNSDIKRWYYYPIVKNNNPNHPAEIYFVKFQNSEYCFRMDIQKDFKGEIEELMASLSMNSQDPVFYGYPYGFIDADSNARITEQEKKMWHTRISVALGKDWKKLSGDLNSMNAHQVLDHIKF